MTTPHALARPDWIVDHKSRMELECRRCGVRCAPVVGSIVKSWIPLRVKFVRDHVGCVQPPTQVKP